MTNLERAATGENVLHTDENCWCENKFNLEIPLGISTDGVGSMIG